MVRKNRSSSIYLTEYQHIANEMIVSIKENAVEFRIVVGQKAHAITQ
jgi:hypothetical protein